MLAQQVAAIFPEVTAQKYLTGTGSEPAAATADMRTMDREVVTVVDYTALVPVLIEALKEQQAEIEELRAQVDQIRQQE